MNQGLVIALNVLLWPVIHVVVSWIALKRRPQSFRLNSFLYRPRAWERGGLFYTRIFRIKSWKKKLPDGAKVMGQGFSKNELKSRDDAYLKTFAIETCRGEWAHWLTLACFPLFLAWNPPWAQAVMVTYAVVANLPCILVQRYNRLVLRRILGKAQSPR